MATLPSLSFSELKRRIELLGFEPQRQKGSHIRYVHKDGRRTTVPDHGSKDVPKGLLTKIVRHDIGMEIEDFFDSTKP